MIYGQGGYQGQYPGQVSFGAADAQAMAVRKLAFLRKVYGLFAASVLFSAVGAMVALYAGLGSSQLVIEVGEGTLVVPPIVAFFSQHWIIGLVLMVGAVFGASAVRHRAGVNVVALFGMSTIVGLVIAPSIFYAQLMARMGGTLSASPIRDAFILAVLGFGGLSAYALVSRRDFSFLGGALFMGLLVVIGAGLLNVFIGSSVLGLAIASVCVLLFGAYILYDTSRMLRDGQQDAVGAAISLYLDFVNLFLALLRILSSRRS
jgi:modulator of FtsH protease